MAIHPVMQHSPTPTAKIIADDFERLWLYVKNLQLESNYKHSCPASDMIWQGLEDTPYTCGYETLAGWSAVDDKERATIDLRV